MNNDQLNFTNELSKLLVYIAAVAQAIRMNSVYNGQYDPRNPVHGNDVMWLSDSLHNFDRLGKALRSGDALHIIATTDYFIESFKRYAMPEPTFKSHPKETFERAERFFLLKEAIDIFEAIKSKAVAASHTTTEEKS